MTTPLIAGLPDRDALPAEACGCCGGLHAATPRPPGNRAGLSEISYRPGDFASFRASQLARLSAAGNPALRRLRSRETDDFTIALIDAWSCVCEVLSFYQDRLANEAWLPTATERQSLVELGRLIGYRPRPGVAASTSLVFLLDDPPGGAATVAAVTIPAGTRVQSVPGPGETAQTFETMEPLAARLAWNALPARRRAPNPPQLGDTGTWLAGAATGLKPGDAVVIAGAEWLADPNSERWDFRKLAAVEPDADAGRTWIGFTEPLGSIDPPGPVAQVAPRIFALRARASLFGWNAPHPNLLADTTRARYTFVNGEWDFKISGDQVVLDGIQDGWGPGSLVVLTRPGWAELYRVEAAVDDGLAAYALSGRATRLTLKGEALGDFAPAYRAVSAYGRSEELFFAEAPLHSPVAGETVALEGLAGDLPPGRRLMLRGRAAQALVAAPGLTLKEGGESRVLNPGERVTLLATPGAVQPDGRQSWRLRAPGGFEGTISAASSAFRFVAALPEAGMIAEPAVLEAVEADGPSHSRLRLADELKLAFDRATLVVHANLAPATHGETTQEILGNGDASRPFQAFGLRQAPLTHVSAPTETGAASTLALRVDELLWTEVPSLYGAAPGDRFFETREGEDSATVVQFGDGRSGARPPSGRNNIVATYRKGLGRAGNVPAGRLTTALDRPLGLRDVFNPLPASGGGDPEDEAGARQNAPVTTLTLGRVVSLRNYEDFARGFGNIAKARADWAWDGAARRVLVTVAGPGGAAVDAASATYADLVRALRGLGDPFTRVSVASYRPAFFRLELKLRLAAGYEAEAVLAQARAALRAAHGFEQRGFAPLLAASEILATLHTLPGVAAVDLERFHRTTPPNAQPILHQRLLARPARLAPSGALEGAEILALDPGPIEITVVP
jgi:hypothetical protein